MASALDRPAHLPARQHGPARRPARARRPGRPLRRARGVVDIGLEGKMLGARLRRRRGGRSRPARPGSASWPRILLSVVLSLVHGFATITHRGNQVVSGMALNIMVAGLGPHARPTPGSSRAAATPITGAGQPLPAHRPAARRPRIGTRAGARPALRRRGQRPQPPGLHRRAGGARSSPGWSTAPASACACAPWARTRRAVDTAGISVEGLRYRALMVERRAAGLAGAYLSIAQGAGFVRDMTRRQGLPGARRPDLRQVAPGAGRPRLPALRLRRRRPGAPPGRDRSPASARSRPRSSRRCPTC